MRGVCLLALSACASAEDAAPNLPPPPPAISQCAGRSAQPGDGKILSAKVIDEQPTALTIDAEYELAVPCPGMRLQTEARLGDGAGITGFVPGILENGHHHVQAKISLLATAPPTIRSDRIVLTIYAPQGVMSWTSTKPFELRHDKLWCRAACDPAGFDRLAHAPIAERLISGVAAIRAQALLDAKPLDQAQREALVLPLLAAATDPNKELAIRFEALDAYHALAVHVAGERAPLLVLARDPAPVLAEWAIKSLVAIAKPGDADIRAALVAAAASHDPRVSRVATENLAHLDRAVERAAKPKLAFDPKNRAACSAHRGTWVGDYCNAPAPDAGRACTDNAQCVGACIAADQRPLDAHNECAEGPKQGQPCQSGHDCDDGICSFNIEVPRPSSGTCSPRNVMTGSPKTLDHGMVRPELAH